MSRTRQGKRTLDRWQALRKAGKLAVVAGSLAWVAILLEAAWSQFVDQLPELHWASLLGGLAFGLLASLLAFQGFSWILSALSPRTPYFRHLAHLYFSAQLMKHLPGRFFGVVYQVATTRGEISTASWIAVNALHMMLIMHMAVLVAGTIVLSEISLMYSFLWAISLLLIGAMAWRPDWIHAITDLVGRLHSPFAAKLHAGLDLLTNITLRRKLEVTLALGSSWMLHLGAWSLFAEAHPALSPHDGIRMCALYTLAWLAGYLSFITPSGLGVRELAFAALAWEYPPEVIAYGMIIGRLSLLTIDLVLGLLFLRTDRSFRETS